MSIVLSSEVLLLIEKRMKLDGYSSADDVVRAALESLDQASQSQIDDDTVDAIECAEADFSAGKGISVMDAFTRLREKHFGP